MMKKLFTILFALCLCMSALAADKVKVTVSNSLSFARGDEYVELDVNALKSKLGTDGSLVVTDADGREVASQLTYDGKLIFQVGVPAKGKSVYYVEAGTPSAYEQKVFGRQFPERVDDIAWENVLAPDVTVAVHAHGTNDQLRNTRFTALFTEFWSGFS